MATFLKAIVAIAVCCTPLTTAAPSSSPIKCPITKDGRIPSNFTIKDFDTTLSPYDPNYSKGQNLSWSQIIKYPAPLSPSRFDAQSHFKSLEVTITDESIFVPGGGSPQLGFRRAGLLIGNGTDATNVGVKTFHWSVRQAAPQYSKGFTGMNLTHEYMNAWHEANSYAYNQFSFNAGIMLSQDYPANCSASCIAVEQGLPKAAWKLLNRNNDIVYVTPIKYDAWQNFAVTLDYDQNTLQIHYSIGNAALKDVTALLPNANDGGGQFQIGILKKPTNTTSVVNDGFQESGIHEGQIYGGIFVEDSAGDCLSR